VRNHFGGGPRVRRRRFAPAEIADLLGDGQEFRARDFEVPENWAEVFQRRISSNREATSLFKRARQLQDAAFAKVAGEDLQADRQASRRRSAGN
jgi:hypothetical protein